MFQIFRAIIRLPFLEPLLRPLTRFVVGAIAIPLFRLFLRNVVRLQELDQELEKDLEQWFRGAILLLVASANMEKALFDWVPLELQGGKDAWIGVSLRLLLAVGVIEAMPDQDLFGLIHTHPPKIEWKNWRAELRQKWWPLIRCFLCRHLSRTSPVFVIMTAIFTGTVGWVCYAFAIVQYLIIGLVTSRDAAMDVLGEFDKQVAARREDIIREFELDESIENRAAEQARETLATDGQPSDGDGIAKSESASNLSEEPTRSAPKTPRRG